MHPRTVSAAMEQVKRQKGRYKNLNTKKSRSSVLDKLDKLRKILEGNIFRGVEFLFS
jgi:hypothetical protein